MFFKRKKEKVVEETVVVDKPVEEKTEYEKDSELVETYINNKEYSKAWELLNEMGVKYYEQLENIRETQSYILNMEKKYNEALLMIMRGTLLRLADSYKLTSRNETEAFYNTQYNRQIKKVLKKSDYKNKETEIKNMYKKYFLNIEQFTESKFVEEFESITN